MQANTFLLNQNKFCGHWAVKYNMPDDQEHGHVDQLGEEVGNDVGSARVAQVYDGSAVVTEQAARVESQP